LRRVRLTGADAARPIQLGAVFAALAARVVRAAVVARPRVAADLAHAAVEGQLQGAVGAADLAALGVEAGDSLAVADDDLGAVPVTARHEERRNGPQEDRAIESFTVHRLVPFPCIPCLDPKRSR